MNLVPILDEGVYPVVYTVHTIGYVYLVTNKVNGKKYIGYTKVSTKRTTAEACVVYRWGSHRGSAKHGSAYPIHRALRKYGSNNFTVVHIESVSGTHADLCAAERRQIAAHNSMVPNGYNLTPGGEGVDLSVPSIREKHRAAMLRLTSDPEWQVWRAETNRKLAENPEWQKSNAAAGKTRSEDPGWQAWRTETNRKLAESPEWQKSVAEADKKRRTDPVWQHNQAEGVSRRTADPAWRENVKEANRKRLATPEGHASQLLKAAKMRIAKMAKAVARDADLPLEERERRERNRELDRVRSARYQAKKRSKQETKPKSEK